MKFYPRHSGRNIQRCVGTEQVWIQSEELSGQFSVPEVKQEGGQDD